MIGPPMKSPLVTETPKSLTKATMIVAVVTILAGVEINTVYSETQNHSWGLVTVQPATNSESFSHMVPLRSALALMHAYVCGKTSVPPRSYLFHRITSDFLPVEDKHNGGNKTKWLVNSEQDAARQISINLTLERRINTPIDWNKQPNREARQHK